jgi:neutral ceramidase
MLLSSAVLCGLAYAGAAAPADDTYLIGRSATDITLPVVGVPMLGFVRADQVSQGLHQRQYARTFVVADAADTTRVALVTCDFAFPTHTLKLAVLERLQTKRGPRYGFANLVLAGTHTHAAPGGYHHHLSASHLGGVFYDQCFDALAEGIAEGVLAADADLKPGKILAAQGDVEGAGVNRSRVAYMNNPAAERARYPTDVDTTMTLLKFVRPDGPIGTLNWFAVHGTSMNYHNKLISGDNKGYAAYAVEQRHGTRYTGKPEFVAAFAQSNAGDVTPNLNLNNTGPGETDVESTRIIGGRQARAAETLLDQAAEPLRGPVVVCHDFVDFSRLVVADAFTGAGAQRTCPSAFGYSFAAGSAEDGGGHPLFREGMTEPRPLIDNLVRTVVPGLSPTAELRECQRPKPILFATGLPKPPAQEQVLPVGLVRIGQLVLVVGPAEFTTMTGRRIRTAVAQELGVALHHVVIAGYANDYAGYVTTHEEYASQQYEGGHTLYGPWTEAGYRQEFVRLARACRTGQPVEAHVMPEDMRRRTMDRAVLDGPDETPPTGARFGDPITDAQERYARGDRVTVSFWTGSPVNEYRRTDHFLAVERLDPAHGEWRPVRADFDWDTTCRWQQLLGGSVPKPEKESPLPGLQIAPATRAHRPDPYQVTITWQTDAATPAGTYRVVHYGRFKKDGKVERFVATSRPFQVGP